MFLAAVPHAAAIPERELTDVLADLHRRGQAAWPKLPLAPEGFVRHLAAVVKGERDVRLALADVHAEDFFLAAACVFRVPGAERAFADAHLGAVAMYVSKIDPRPAFTDEVRQELARKLFVPEPGDAPKIAAYGGRGALAAFVRVTASRMASNMKRSRAEEHLGTTKETNQPARDLDPEVMLLKSRFAREFETAFAETMGALSVEERNVLKMHYLQGLTIDDVGKACNVSRATAARWLAKARTRIVQLTYTSFAASAGPNSASPHSMLALVKSELGATVAKYFDSERTPSTGD